MIIIANFLVISIRNGITIWNALIGCQVKTYTMVAFHLIVISELPGCTKQVLDSVGLFSNPNLVLNPVLTMRTG